MSKNTNTHHVVDDYGRESQHKTSRDAHEKVDTQVNGRVEVRDVHGRAVSTYEKR